MPLVPKDQYTASFLSPYPDLLAFGLAIVLSVALALGVKESSRLNNVFTSINIVVIVFVIIAAGTRADPTNWAISSDDIGGICNLTDSKPWGTGGFAPFGFKGIMEGAATCFFGFVGFDIIATTGEEAINPSRTIPISIGVSLLIIFLSYFGVSAVVTLAAPYCLLDEDAPLVVLFEYLDWESAKWFVSIGALFGFCASLFGAMFPLPRVIYAMASDGLLFRTLAQVSKKFQTPTFATVISGLFAGGMAMIFNLDALVNMMSIGTLMAYTIVSLCVLLLRYSVNEDVDNEEEGGRGVEGGGGLLSSSSSSSPLPPPYPSSSSPSSYSLKEYLRQLFNRKGITSPTDLTSSLVTKAIFCFCVLVVVLDALLVALHKYLANGEGWAIALVVVMAVLNILCLTVIARQPQSKKRLSFKVPLVPWLPALSTFINLYLMCNLHLDTWIRFAVWMAIGFLDYFAYGLWHSSIRKKDNTLQGVDNLAFNHSNDKSHQLIIPKIEIHPATPLSSEPNTPVVKPKTQQTESRPSPLANQEKKEVAKKIERGDVKPLDAAALLASLMSSGKIVKEEEKRQKEGEKEQGQGKEQEKGKGDDDANTMKGRDEGEENEVKSKGDNDSNMVVKEREGKVEDKVNDRIVIENKERDGKESMKGNGEVVKYCEGLVESSVTEAIVNISAHDASVAPLEDVKKDTEIKEVKETGELTKTEDTEGEKKKSEVKGENEETQIKSGQDDSKDVKEKESDKFKEKDEEKIKDDENKKEETEEEIDGKPKSNKPPSLSPIFRKLLNDKNTAEIPRAYYSSPEISPQPSPPQSAPPQPQKSQPFTSPKPRPHPILVRSQSEANLHHSVPTTPAGQRHPIKKLRRMSSFDDIPPSSPDSPFARRVASFVVIPVHEPGMESNESSITPSPCPSPSASKSNLFQAVDLLNTYKKEEERKMFTLGSTDSLNSLSGEGSDGGGEFLGVRRGGLGVSRETLDPIRERGESKLYVSEGEKEGKGELQSS